MAYIHVSQLNFEYEESNSYHDILVNSGANTQSLVEEIVSVAHIYVSAINLEIPVGEANADVLTNNRLATHTLLEAEVASDVLTTVCVATHTLEEVIVEAPVEPEVPVPVVGGGTGQRPRFLGGPPWEREFLTNSSQNSQEIEEAIYVSDDLYVVAQMSHGIDAKIRKPIYKPVRQYEIVSYQLDDKEMVAVAPSEHGFTRRSKKEEEELILLGII